MANVTQMFDNFQSRLSSLMTKALNEQLESPASDSNAPTSPVILERYPEGQQAVPVTPSEFADCLAVQQQVSDRLQAALQSPSLPRHTIAEMARFQRLKRISDVQTMLLKVEHEMHRLWSLESVDEPQKVFTRRKAITTLQKETIALLKQSEQLVALIAGSGPSKAGTSSTAASPGRRLELIIYYSQESIEMLLRAVLEFGSTINAIICGGVGRKSAAAGDDQRVLQEFDALGKRISRSSTSSLSSPNSPRVVEASAEGFDAISVQVNFAEVINRLFSALPVKYDLTVLKAVDAAAAAVAAEQSYN